MSTDRKGYIYRILNKVSGKSYIGQTIRDPNERFYEHIHSSTKDDPGCRAIALAIRSYGVGSFIFEIIIECYAWELDFLEAEMIEIYNTMADSGHGYNLYQGGRNTYKGHTGSARDKISAGQRKHFDGIHDLPRFVSYVPPGKHGEGYAVASSDITFMQFSANVFTLDEKYDYAISYLIGDKDRDEIRNEYNKSKQERRQNNIQKKVVIDNEEFVLPAHMIWYNNRKIFIVRRPGKKTKEFGNSKISIKDNYNKAIAYYNS